MELTHENYFSKEASLYYTGASQIKAFIKCQACAVAELNGTYQRNESVALMQGKYLDALFEGNKEIFELTNKVLKKDGTPYAHFTKTIEAYERIKKDPIMFDLCANGQQQVIMTGEIQGVPVKIAIDILRDDMIIDRKYTKDFNDMWVNGIKMNFAEAWGYDIQGAIYQTIVEQNTGKKLPFVLACVSKEVNPDVEVFVLSQETLDNALALVRANIENIQELKQGLVEPVECGTCAYCKQHKKIDANFENWRVL